MSSRISATPYKPPQHSDGTRRIRHRLSPRGPRGYWAGLAGGGVEPGSRGTGGWCRLHGGRGEFLGGICTIATFLRTKRGCAAFRWGLFLLSLLFLLSPLLSSPLPPSPLFPLLRWAGISSAGISSISRTLLTRACCKHPLGIQSYCCLGTPVATS